MKSRWCYNRGWPMRATSRPAPLFLLSVIATLLASAPQALASADAPAWMHAAANAPVPAYDEKTDAVLLYSETNVTIVSKDRITTQVREAYKILRPNGRHHGTLAVD